MGIDPGLAHTGWAVIETNGMRARARAYDCIATSATIPLDGRLATIAQRINAALQSYHPQAVAVEKIFFGQNHKSAISTAHARAAALVATGSAHLELGEYTPMQIKQAVVGTGSADKRQVTYMVRSILQLDHDPQPDHCADALAAALCHFTMTCSSLGKASQLAGARGAVQNVPVDRVVAPSVRESSAQRMSVCKSTQFFLSGMPQQRLGQRLGGTL